MSSTESNSSILATQNTLNGLSTKFGGKTPVRIHFLDNSSKMFLIGSNETVKEFLETILEKYEVNYIQSCVQYFSLFESYDGLSMNKALNSDDYIIDTVRAWTNYPDAKLIFMIRLFMPSIWGFEYRDELSRRIHKPDELLSLDVYLVNALVIDKNILNLQYLQAVYHIITGVYNTTEAQAVQLGAIHFLFKFGLFKPNAHTTGFLGNRVVEFIPVKHLRKSGKSLDQWEQELLDAADHLAQEMSMIDEGEYQYEQNLDDSFQQQNPLVETAEKRQALQASYMKAAIQMDFYGRSFFKCQQKASRYSPENPVLGVHAAGLSIFDKGRKLYHDYHIAEMLRWGFKVNKSFTIEVPAIGTIDFQTTEAQQISDLLTDYALSHIKENELLKLRTDAALRKATTRSNSTDTNTFMLPTTNKEQQKRLLRSVVKVQALYRGYALRRDWVREDAAILIQAVFRGYLARIEIGKLIEKMIQSGELQTYD